MIDIHPFLSVMSRSAWPAANPSLLDAGLRAAHRPCLWKIRGFDESKITPNKLAPFVPSSFERYLGI
jgi:hypothetical protein